MAVAGTKQKSAYELWLSSPEATSIIAKATKAKWSGMTAKEREPFETERRNAETLSTSQR